MYHHPGVLLARAMLAAGAVVVCGWFVLGARQAHEADQASRIVNQRGPITASQAKHADSLLRSAGRLNPDSQVEILRGELAYHRNDRKRASRLFADVVLREPMNVSAWYWLAQAPPSPDAFKYALAKVAQLEPHLPPS